MEIVFESEHLPVLREVIELLILVFMLRVHEAVGLIDHVLLASSTVLEELVTEQALVG